MVQPASHSAVAAPMIAPNQALGLIAQIAATAGSVAIGSVGNTVGHAHRNVQRLRFTRGSLARTDCPVSGEANAPAGPCSWEIKQLLSCTQGQAECDSEQFGTSPYT
ncbi:hemiasterlin resistant protein 1-like [Topomyia yanbarensis]|uniref:hemiasterlin resistant protein 1-like n=1 Tax=Topomyia yanbarensis TaxID=2498891 RepID=UPI00273B9266|nr:hemiasterlin resistant protein 1-like [Topomyia yanbarensis]